MTGSTRKIASFCQRIRQYIPKGSDFTNITQEFLEEVDIVGSFLLGFLTAMTPSGSLMMFAAIGVCGSFTTFSTYSVHSVALLQEGRYGAAVVYIIGTVILCLILAWAGLIAGQRINSHI